MWLNLIRLSYLLAHLCFQNVPLLDFFLSSWRFFLFWLFFFRCPHSSSMSPVELPSDKQPKWNWYVSQPAIPPFSISNICGTFLLWLMIKTVIVFAGVTAKKKSACTLQSCLASSRLNASDAQMKIWDVFRNSVWFVLPMRPLLIKYDRDVQATATAGGNRLLEMFTPPFWHLSTTESKKFAYICFI